MKLNRLLFMLTLFSAALFIQTQPVQAWCDPGELVCGSVIDSNNSHGHTDVNRYNCTGSTNYNGKAHVFRLSHPGDSLHLRLHWTLEENNKLHLFVLGSCDRNDCIAHADSVLDLDLPADDYWIIVDGRTSNWNAYQLTVDCGDQELSTELLGFSATAHDNGIALSWSTASETNNNRFEIQRRQSSTDIFDMIAAIPGHGTTAELSSYNYMDRDVSEGAYVYKLSSVDMMGAREEIATAMVVMAAPPQADPVTEFELVGNYPNPFNPSTMIRFNLAEKSDITLDVFDVQGRLVSQLLSETRNAGSYEVMFDATGMSSGVYFARLSTPLRSDLMKMVLMK